MIDFAVPAKRKKIKESEKIDTWTLPENWKTAKHEGDGDTNCNWCTWNSLQGLGEGTVGLPHRWYLPEFQESRRPEETCCPSDSIERLPTDANVKDSQGVK